MSARIVQAAACCAIWIIVRAGRFGEGLPNEQKEWLKTAVRCLALVRDDYRNPKKRGDS